MSKSLTPLYQKNSASYFKVLFLFLSNSFHSCQEKIQYFVSFGEKNSELYRLKLYFEEFDELIIQQCFNESMDVQHALLYVVPIGTLFLTHSPKKTEIRSARFGFQAFIACLQVLKKFVLLDKPHSIVFKFDTSTLTLYHLDIFNLTIDIRITYIH